MKLIKTLGFIFCFTTFFGQNNTILEIDNQTVNKIEFEQIYWKNKKDLLVKKKYIYTFYRSFTFLERFEINVRF